MNIINGRTSVTWADNGVVTRVADVQSGRVHFAANGRDERLFELVVPGSAWPSRTVGIGDAEAPRVVEKAEGVVLCYDRLMVEGRPAGIVAEVEFQRAAGTDEVRLALRLRNEGKETITGAAFPWLCGWQGADEAGRDWFRVGPHGEIDPASFPWWTCAWGNGTQAQEHTVNYPTYALLPWIDISGPGGGVSCINYQRTPRQCYAAVRNMAGHEPGRRIAIMWGFYAYVRPGEQWESPPIGIAVHEGDWRETADRYREWVSTWRQPRRPNRRLRESIGSEQVFFSYFDGAPCRDYETLPAIAATARGHGVSELCVWDRLSLGTYVPALRRDEDLLGYGEGDRARLAGAVKQAVREGSDVSALVNFRLLNPALEVAVREGLGEETQRALDGTHKMEMWSLALLPGHFSAAHLGPYCRLFSPFSAKYRERLLRQIDAYLELGYTSLFYDQPFEKYPDYSGKDAGQAPETAYAATLELVRAVREKLLRAHPEAAIMGEQCDIFGAEVIDQWMIWTWSNKDIASAIRTHYALPDTVINCVVDRETGLASHAFAAGLHLLMMTKAGTGTLADAPEFAAHVGKLAALRKRCAARTVHGRFCETRGLTVESDEGLAAYSYESAAGPAVIVAAPEKAGQAKVTLDRSAFAAAGDTKAGQVLRLGGDSAAVSGDTQTFDLAAYEVLVWLA